MNPAYDIFKLGRRYRVKQSFDDGIYNFIKDEVLVFKYWGFIPYDGVYGYQFHSDSDSETARDKLWTLIPTAPPEAWHERFEAVE